MILLTEQGVIKSLLFYYKIDGIGENGSVSIKIKTIVTI